MSVAEVVWSLDKGTHGDVYCCREAFSVHSNPSGTPQVPAATRGGVLWSWRPAGVGVSPPTCQGAASPC